MKKILIDSGPLIALFDASDNYHHEAINFIQSNITRCYWFESPIKSIPTLNNIGFNNRNSPYVGF